MALVTMREILQDARNKKYAVGGFNVFNFETLSAVVEVAEELKTPVVLGIPERLFKFVDVDILGSAMVRAAERASVPIALHLDHGHSYEGVMRAIRWGFTSVMFDGSQLEYAENLKRTKEFAKIAHSLGITIEGELGYSHWYDKEQPDVAAKPERALNFIDKTRIDAFAVGVGQNHGMHGGTPLDTNQLAALNSTVHVPLVMHGGSRSRNGFSREDYHNYIQSGISKINIATDMSMIASQNLKKELSKSPGANYIHLMSVVKNGVKDSVRQYMLYFDCISKSV